MLRILVTGFAPFGGRAENTSWRLACSLGRSARAEVPGSWTARCLSVDHHGAKDELADHLVDDRPDVLFMMGEWSGPGFRVEAYGRPMPLAPHRGGPRVARWPLTALIGALRSRGLPARLSRHAGSYVCDTTYWAALGTTVPKVVFLHVPRDLPPGRDRTVCRAIADHLDACLQ